MTLKNAQQQANSTVKDAQKQAYSVVKDARKQASSTVMTARKEARRQLVRARIATVRARAAGRAKAAGASKKAVGAAGAVGLAAGYFLDPDAGKRRRNVVRDRALAVIRRGTDRAEREAHYREGQVDQALADRVKSEIFQPADAPKESVNVNVEGGVVYLRGEVKRPDQIRTLVEQAGAVDGVAGVENLLQTP